jgi:hypothetical protein
MEAIHLTERIQESHKSKIPTKCKLTNIKPALLWPTSLVRQNVNHLVPRSRTCECVFGCFIRHGLLLVYIHRNGHRGYRVRLQMIGNILQHLVSVQNCTRELKHPNLSSLFNGFRASSFEWTAIPRLVHAGFGLAWIMRNLEQPLTGLVFTNKTTSPKMIITINMLG